mgnify:CR=1 FL=1
MINKEILKIRKKLDNLDNNLLNGEEIIRFIEKPNISEAKDFITQKRFTWNSGMFLFKASIELRSSAPFVLIDAAGILFDNGKAP